MLIFELMEGGDLWNFLKRQPASRPLADSVASSPTASGTTGLLGTGGGSGVSAGSSVAPAGASLGGHPAMALSEDDARNVFQQVSQ